MVSFFCMYSPQWPSANPILMSGIPYANNSVEFFDAVSKCFNIKISNLKQMHQECESRPGALNQIYACMKTGIVNLEDDVDPREIWNGKADLEPLHLLKQRRFTWSVRRRMIAFMCGCKKRGFYVDLRRILSLFLTNLYCDYAHVYSVLCGNDRNTFNARTNPFLNDSGKRLDIFRRLSTASVECVHRGFSHVDFYDHVESYLVQRIGMVSSFDTLQWIRYRKFGGRLYSSSSISTVRPFMCLLYLGRSYRREIMRRHYDELAPHNYFYVYNVFSHLQSMDEKDLIVCIDFCMRDFALRFKNRLKEELQSERFLRLLQRYPQLSKFYTLL